MPDDASPSLDAYAPRKVGRPARPPETVAEATLTIRVTVAERAGLERLVAKRQAELADTGAMVTAASVLRALLRRELDAEERRAAAEPAPVEAAPAPPPKPRKVRVEAPAEAAVRRELVRAFKAKRVALRTLAEALGVDAAQLTRFKGGASYPPARLPALAAALGVKP